jgi:hypothetical protein
MKINMVHNTKIFSMSCMNAQNIYDDRYGTRFGYIRKHDFNSAEHLKYVRFGLEECNETQRLGQRPHLCSGGAAREHHHKNKAAPSYVQRWCNKTAHDDSAAYSPRASHEETEEEGEETSGLLSPRDQGRLGR